MSAGTEDVKQAGNSVLVTILACNVPWFAI